MRRKKLNKVQILSNVKNGWCKFEIEDFHGTPSYIKYLPMNILDAWEEYQKTGHCVIEFDEEVSEFCVVIWDSWNDNAVILTHDNGYKKCHFLKIGGSQLLTLLVSEIVSNVDMWAKWCSSTNDYSAIKQELESRIKSLGLK